MNKDNVKLLLCPECGANDLSLKAYLFSTDDQIVEGSLTCVVCGNWYRIENEIIDLLPMSIKQTNYDRFIYRNEQFAKKYGLRPQKINESLRENQLGNKTKPIGAFEDVSDYEKRVVNNAYYRALDQIAFHNWIKQNLSDKDFVLDVGCGTGRQCVPLTENNIRTIGIDIDEDMLKVAVSKIHNQAREKLVDFIVADGEAPPVLENSFTACVLYGVLHHLPDKPRAIMNASTKLLPGGFIYSLDPHKSPFRFAFDFLMKIKELYIEEASDDPLISEVQLQAWMKSAKITGETKLSTHLPLHIFVGTVPQNIWLLKTTDKMFSRFPWIRKLGGVIIFEGKKL